MKHTCCGNSWEGHNSYRCGKTASIEEGGKWYCRIHAPSLVAAKRDARDAKWRASRFAAETARRRAQLISDAKAKIVELTRELMIDRRKPGRDGMEIVGLIVIAVAELEQLERQS